MSAVTRLRLGERTCVVSVPAALELPLALGRDEALALLLERPVDA